MDKLGIGGGVSNMLLITEAETSTDFVEFVKCVEACAIFRELVYHMDGQMGHVLDHHGVCKWWMLKAEL